MRFLSVRATEFILFPGHDYNFTRCLRKQENSIWNQQGGYSEISIDLPQNGYAGKSVTIELD